MKVEIHPGNPSSEVFSKFVAHQYLDFKDGNETIITFPDETEIPVSLYSASKHSMEEEEDFLEFELGLHFEKTIFYYKGETFNLSVKNEFPKPVRITRCQDKFYTTITVEFTGSYSGAFTNLSKDVTRWYSSHIMKDKKTENYINIFINIESYWNKLVEKPKRDLSTVYLPKTEIELLKKKISDVENPKLKEANLRRGKINKFICLLYGPPGTGKTSLIHAIASYLSRDIAMYTNNSKLGDEDLVKLVRNSQGKIICFEDMDDMVGVERNDSKINGMTTSGIINTLDGFLCPAKGNKALIVFLTTNNIDKICKPLIRPGRIDHFIEFGDIKKKEREKMFCSYFENSYYERFEEAFSELRCNVTAATLDMYLYGYFGNPEGAISNVSEIVKLKELTVSDSNKDLYS